MNRVLVSMLLGSLAALPATASAQYYPTTVWSAPYETLAGSATALSLSPDGRTGQIELDKANGSLPFDVTYNGVTYQKMRVGAKGFVTFGASAATSSTAATLVNATGAEPKNLVAVWWGDHYCDPAAGEIRSQTLGTKAGGDLRFVVEWKCSKGSGTTTATTGSSTRFRAQLVIFDLPDDAPFGSNNVIRAVYGEALVDGTNDWSSLSWGQRFTAGTMGPGASGVPVCTPTATTLPKCTSNHFPTNTVIQYGQFPTRADLSAKVDVLSFSVDNSRVNLDLKTTFANSGMAPAPGVTFNVYLTDSPESFNPASAYPVGSHATPFDVAALATAHVVTDSMSSNNRALIANGRYHVCIDIDPSGLVGEADRSNNRACSTTRVTVGPDLTGTVAIPSTVGQAKARYDFPVTLSNVGTEAASNIEYVISAVPVPDNDGNTITPVSEVYWGVYTGTLAAGETTQQFMVSAELPRWLRDDKFRFEIIVDPYKVIRDANWSNNTFLSIGQMTNQKPKIALTPQPVTITFPFGCYYGQPVHATYRLCNQGQMNASGFRTGIAMGDYPDVNLLDDAAAATFPQYCGKLHDPDSRNRQQCKPVNGIMPECPYEYCVVQCDPNDDTICPAMGPPGQGLKCLYDYSWNEMAADLGTVPPTPYYTCQLDIKPVPTDCRTITVSGVIPRANKHERDPHLPGEKYFHVMDDIDMMLSETTPVVWSTPEPIQCFESLPDFESTTLNMPERVVAGEPFAVDRSIRNMGFIELPWGQIDEPETVTVEYGYYLSRRRDDVSTNQIFAKVKSTDGFGVVTLGSKANGVRNEDRRPELIQIPAEIEPGIYYVGIILDPNGHFRELDKTNNTKILDNPIVVAPPSLTINGDPPSTVVLGSLVTYQFVAMGGVGTCRWTAESLPPGLALNPDGLMTGRVSELGSHAYKIKATCGDLTATRAYVMQVVEYRGTLAIVTNDLPPARTGQPYGLWIDEDKQRHEGVQLVATGGLPPYTWEVVVNRPPQGLNLTREGLITGTPTSFSDTRTFTVQVKDKAGNVAEKSLTIEKVGEHTLTFNRYNFPDAETAFDYNSTTSCVTVSGGTPPYSWTHADVPPGLEATSNDNTLCVQGVPTRAGNFEVVVSATDSTRQSVSARLPLTVTATALPINNPALPNVSRGETIDIRLVASAFEKRPSRQVVFTVVSGSLPDGLVLSSEGVIAGTVSKDAPFGTYNFMVRAEDDWGRVGQRPFAITVNVEARKPIVEVTTKKGGCSSSGGMDLSLLGLALAGIGAFRRSRRKAEGID